MMMNEFEFTLKFALPENEMDQESVAARLYSEGCDDALIGIGKKGRIALDFTRAAPSCVEAVKSAVRDVHRIVPGVRFIEAQPDLVGVSDVAEIADCTRQNVRKIVLSDATFPTPIHGGNPELFHLVEVLDWMTQTQRIKPKSDLDIGQLHAVASTSRAFNIEMQARSIHDEVLLSEVREICEI
ncbi:hypothetical protein XACM_1061 [Xanthomonas euvesicatoria pv. citrumelo F1]|nr:hypothetical protein XACM_1061 [Xanthomonas euvesicatoria pv. citrumelo F1]